jgi:hypothetical protein
MYTYWFDLEVSGPVTEGHVEALADVLVTAGGIDATVQAGAEGGSVMFSRTSDSALRAVISAVEHLRAAGMNVTGAREDLVVDHRAAETARACALVNATLTNP